MSTYNTFSNQKRPLQHIKKYKGSFHAGDFFFFFFLVSNFIYQIYI
jgi:hypothetical protein